MNVFSLILKIKFERRDLMLKEVEKFVGWGVDKFLVNVKMNWMDRIYFLVSDYVDRVVRFFRIDKLQYQYIILFIVGIYFFYDVGYDIMRRSLEGFNIFFFRWNIFVYNC